MKNKFFVFILIILSFLFIGNKVFASTTLGTIDTTASFAWGENIGWVNFNATNGDVKVSDTGLSGYALSENAGWIYLGDVANDGEGNLSGFAYGENVGYIKFNPTNGGVTINQDGEFFGSALSENAGWIIFSGDYQVKTDWRPKRTRHTNTSSGGYIRPNINKFTRDFPNITAPIINIVDNVGESISNTTNSVLEFLHIKEKSKVEIVKEVVEIPKIAPPSFDAKWNILPEVAISNFVFAPLPYEIRMLALKFPELDKTLKSVGVKNLSDLNKLSGVSLNIPGISQVEKLLNNVGTGNIALVQGLPISNFPLLAKKNLPSEFVFARADGEKVDLNVAMSVNDKGDVSQKISSLPGENLKLVVKPISKAKSVTGYFVFKSATPRISKIESSRNFFSAAILLAFNNNLVEQASPIEQKLVLSSFTYTDPDGDGIYTADVISPSVSGEYEIITVIGYVDPVLGTRQMRLITVIDPEGYIYRKNNGEETRIPGAVVSLYSLNTTTNTYELWRAKEFQQENPQTTDVRGVYSFLVPEGLYYFQVQAPNYLPYKGEVFSVVGGNSIHQNIELKLKQNSNFFAKLDWKMIIIVVLLLLIYNLFKNTLKDRLLKLFKKNGK